MISFLVGIPGFLDAFIRFRYTLGLEILSFDNSCPC